MIINLNLPPETSQDTSTVLPSAYGPMVVEASRPDSSTITGVLGGTENRDYILLNVVLGKNVTKIISVIFHVLLICPTYLFE